MVTLVFMLIERFTFPPSRPVGIFILAVLMSCAIFAGCEEEQGTFGKLDLVWGRRGVSDGRMQKPRAIAIDAEDNLYIVDMTARIQVFSPDGEFLRTWQTPAHENGRPTGLAIDQHGRVVVADTHYYQVLFYSNAGELLGRFGGEKGNKPGQLGWVTDAVQDTAGHWYVSEYGEFDKITKLTAEGEFIQEWGGHGSEPGQFVRPQKLVIDEQQRIWVADACNHRIQVFDTEGRLLMHWGEQGSGPGQLYYPYDLLLRGENVYVLEYGNHRVQKFTRSGQSLGQWGHEGRGPGELYNPWGLVMDSQGRLHVLDSNNHRVQRVRL